MTSRCIARIYDPRPRSEEVCGLILPEPKARAISNRKLPTTGVEGRIYAPIHLLATVHMLYTMIHAAFESISASTASDGYIGF